MGDTLDGNKSGSNPKDLNITVQPDTNKDYFTFPVTNLKIGTGYALNFQWVYQDGTVSKWSPGYFFVANSISSFKKPNFTSGNLSYFQGLLKVTWDGTDYTGAQYGSGFKKIHVWIKDNSDPSGLFYIAGELTAAGTFSIAVVPKSYSVKLSAMTVDGQESPYSDTFTVTAKISAPSTPTNVVAAWVGSDFVVTFTHDPSAGGNEYLKEYIITLKDTAPGGLEIPWPLTPKSGSSQRFVLSTEDNERYFFGASSFSGSVKTLDIYNNIGTPVVFNTTGYVTNLSAPIITVSEIINGYSVSYAEPSSSDFKKIYIEEVVSDALTAPSTGYNAVTNGTTNPIQYSSGAGKRWVRARFLTKLNQFTGYSNIQAVTPIDIIAAAVDALAPDPIQSATAAASVDTTDSSGLSGIINLTVVNAVSTVPSDFNGYIVKIVRTSDSKQWTQEFLSKTYLTTLPVKLGIATGQSYTLSVATTDGRNQSAFVNVTGNPISVTDTRTNTSVATSLLLSATDSILTVRWTAPNDANVESYRVQLTSNADTTFSTPLQEVYTQSTTASFGGLTSNTTYRIRVTTKYSGSSGALSTNHLTGTATLNSSGAISDGVAPTTNPTITTSNIKSLFGAFAITFPAVTNADAVTYQVFIKPTDSTGIVSDTYKVLEVNGTFAVVKTLADKTTALSYGTNYYIAIRAKDNDGVSTGTVTPVGPVQTLQVQNADLAADSVYANNIKAGEIDASKMTTDLLFTNKTINVGESTSLNRIRLDANTVTMTDTDLASPSTYTAKSRIFIGAGNYYSSGTSLYADNTGRLSIADKLKFDGTNLTINGSGTFTGLLTTGSGSNVIKVGTGANGANNGIYIGATSDYIYTDGTFRLGAGKVTYSSGLLQIDGQLKVKNNSTLEGDLQLLSPGIFYIGTNKTIGGTGDKIIIDSGGIAAYPSGSSSSVFQLDTTGYLKVNNALIANWTVNASQISKTSGTNTIKLDSTTASIQADGTGYTAGFGLPDANNIVFWAGGSRSTAQFKVFKDGSVSLPAATFSGVYATTGDLSAKANSDLSNVGSSTVESKVTIVTGGKVQTGTISSTGYAFDTNTGYASQGMSINLDNGAITSKQFKIDSSGNASFLGTVSANNINGGTFSGAQINLGNGVFTVSTAGVLNASSGTFSGNVSGGTFSLSGYTGTNYWSGSTFNAGSSSSYINVSSSSGTVTLFSKISSQTDSDPDSGSTGTIGGGAGTPMGNIPQQIVVDNSYVSIQGLQGIGNGLTKYGDLLGPFGDGIAYVGTTQYWAGSGTGGYVGDGLTNAFGQQTHVAGREPSYNYGAAARYRMVVADPYDYNKLKRGFGVYYGVKNSNAAPTASTGFVGDIWISW